MQEHHINCRGCQKPDKDTFIGKMYECHFCDGTGDVEEAENGVCPMCLGEGMCEYIPKTSQHHWARVDAYNIYTGLYCDKCYKDNYPYKKDRYFDESYCGERMEADY